MPIDRIIIEAHNTTDVLTKIAIPLVLCLAVFVIVAFAVLVSKSWRENRNGD